MKKQTLDRVKPGNVVVYMHFVNAWGEVNETVEIARFRTMSWAENFIAAIRAEEKASVGEYTDHIYEIKEG